MKYRSGQEAKLGDQVLGVTKSGQPVAGNVLQIDKEKSRVQISPAIQSASWVPATDCALVESVFEPEGAKSPGSPERAPQQEPDKEPATTATADQGS